MDALQEKIMSLAFIEKFKCSMLQNSGEHALIEWYFKIRFVLYNDVRVMVALTELHIFIFTQWFHIHLFGYLKGRNLTEVENQSTNDDLSFL